ncbi:mitochondrial Rho GTPase isoform X2 [Planococcus citri]|uniref:mitochondrial Rho GTPase isoform X2 n=1 Tax=Planococcus citri TaxID=170843 RepID=UPI0031F8C9C5
MVRTSCRRNVRILLVGDKGVGKTSIILSLVSEEFPEDVPSKAEEITIPADVTPELVPTHIVDYSETEQTEEVLTEEIQRAHVICVVYSVINQESLSNVSSYWLPLIRKSTPEPHCPIVLVGNKVDLINDSTYELAGSIMDEYPEIESFIECSAKTLVNISEVFYFAQNAVLHPTAPIYITDKQELTEGCVKALTRIFKICDFDNDGLLSDKELNLFQKRCFDTPLRKEAMQDIKTIISKNINGGISSNNMITLAGFLFLHNLFMQRGRSQTTWAVLRRFGYQENLDISKEYLYPKLTVPNGCSVELSHKGYQFLSSLFERYDKDKDGALCPKEVEAIFSVCPTPAFNSCISNMVSTNSKGWITQEGWFCFWSYTTLFDYATTLEYLAYFGYPITDYENQCTAVQVTRDKKSDILKKQSLRNVYVCHIIGEKGSGKSSLCQTHIGHTLKKENVELAANLHHHGTTNIVNVYCQEKYLILKNIDIRNSTEPLMPSDVNCDVACLVYDSSHTKSFEYVAKVFLKYFSGSNIPVLIVANKIDLGTVRQDYFIQPETFCKENNLPAPIEFSSIRPKKDLFVKLATMAAFPHSLGLIGGYEMISLWRSGVSVKAGVSVTMIALLALFLAKFLKSEKSAR